MDGLKLYLDEVGWQVDTSGRIGYAGRENVPVTNEAEQAAIYGALVRKAACDPTVAELNFFGFHDDGLRTGFQAGLYRADGTPRPAADAVRQAIVDTASGCRGTSIVWVPATGVIGARAGGVPLEGLFGPVLARTPLTIAVDAVAGEGATARAFADAASRARSCPVSASRSRATQRSPQPPQPCCTRRARRSSASICRRASGPAGTGSPSSSRPRRIRGVSR